MVMSVFASARAMDGTPWKEVGRTDETSGPKAERLNAGMAWCIMPVHGPMNRGIVVMAMCTNGVKATVRELEWNCCGSWACSW